MTSMAYDVLQVGSDQKKFGEFLREERVEMVRKEPLEIDAVVVPDEHPACPFCGKKMVKNGTAPRRVTENDRRYVFRIQVYLCKSCRKGKSGARQYTHRALPEEILPYKRTPSEVLFACGELGEEEQRRPQDENLLGCAQSKWKALGGDVYDTRTQSRWKEWFGKFRTRIAGTLRALGERANIEWLVDAASWVGKERGASGQLDKAVRKLLKMRGRLSI